MIRDTGLAAVTNAIIPGVGQINIAPGFRNTAGSAILGEPEKGSSLDMRDMQPFANSYNAPVGSGCYSHSSTIVDRDRTSPSSLRMDLLSEWLRLPQRDCRGGPGSRLRVGSAGREEPAPPLAAHMLPSLLALII